MRDDYRNEIHVRKRPSIGTVRMWIEAITLEQKRSKAQEMNQIE